MLWLTSLPRERAEPDIRQLLQRSRTICWMDEDDPASLDLYQLQDMYASIETTVRRCTRNNDSLVNQETDESRQEEDETACTVNFLVWKYAKSLVNYRCDYTPLTRSVRFTQTGECEHQCAFLMIFMARYNPWIYWSCVVHISESQQLSPSPEK